MSIRYLNKTPGATIDVALDFGQLLAGAALQSATWSPQDGIVAESQSMSGSIASAKLSGGAAGSDYIVSAIGVDASGARAVLSVIVRVRAAMSVPTSDLDSIERLVTLDVSGCPIDVIRDKISEAAHDFCKDSFAWISNLASFSTVAGQKSYELVIPDQSMVVAIKSVRINDRDLAPGLPDDVRQFGSSGRPQMFDHDDTSLMLSPVPDEDGSPVSVVAVLAPALGARRLPAFLADRHRVALAAGAKSRLMMMAGQTWSNAQLAQYFDAQFKVAVSGAARTARLGRAGAALRVRPRRFGA